MSRSCLIAAVCDQHRLLTEALAATRKAIIITSAAGMMLLCTEPAERCLERYFESETPAAANCELPEPLRAWISHHVWIGNAGAPGPRPPLIVEREIGRLTVHLLDSEITNHRLLIFNEEACRPCATKLQVGLGLTAREAQVLFWVSQGKMNAGIGILLGMSPATVEKHLEHIFAKLKVETRTAAALCAHEVLSGQCNWQMATGSARAEQTRPPGTPKRGRSRTSK